MYSSGVSSTATAKSSKPAPSCNLNPTSVSGFTCSNQGNDFSFGRSYAKTGHEKGNHDVRKPRLVKVRRKTLKESNFKVVSGFDGEGASRSSLNGDCKVNVSSFRSNVNGFVFGASSSSSSMSNANAEHVEFGLKDDKCRKSNGVPNLNSERNGCVNDENKGTDLSNSNIEKVVFDGIGNSEVRLKSDKENGVFVFGGNKSSNCGKGGFVFGGKLNIDGACFGLDAKTKDASISTNNQDGSVFSSTAFEFGISSNFVPTKSAEKVVESGENECGTGGTSEKCEGNNRCSDSKSRWDDNTGFGEKIKLPNSGKGDNEDGSGTNLEESLLPKLSDKMMRFTIHDGEATVRANKVEESTDFFCNFNTKFEFGSNQNSFGVNNRSTRGKNSKKSKSMLWKGLLAEQHLSGEDNVPKRFTFQKNDDSPGCGSPMEFSPYRPNDDAASGLEGNGDSQASNSSNDFVNQSNCELGSDFPNSNSTPDGLSSIRHQYRKKYKLKVGNGLKESNHSQKAASNSFSEQSPTMPWTKKTSNPKSKSNNMGYIIQERPKPRMADVTSEQACYEWRIKGNQAYKAGNLSIAEEYYTKGIDSVPDESLVQPLLLCYGNRAATRMSLGRMREALSDCKKAAALDPSFVKIKLRAANCHLVLGEVKDAELYYNDCLESERLVCLDRRTTIEAADGLQKAQKVAQYMRQSDELLQQCSSDAANSALEIISEALKISIYSDKLFEMKGEALCKLLMYEEAIQLCEKTLDIAERNFLGYGHEVFPRLWRWRVMAKSHYYLGKLELALDLIEKEEKPNALAVSIRQLLAHKKAGNEAFQCGRHGEAVEHYTGAISKKVESLPFAAICFCNRAAAYQAMGQLIDAIADCSLAIALDQNYSKAVSRRATLHELIRDYDQAATDLQRLVYLLENQPQKGRSGGSSSKELKLTRTRLSSIEKKLKKGAPLDLYLILGVKTSDAESDIKKAYRKAALRHHPDKAAQLLARNDVGDDGKVWKEIIEKVHKDADRLFKMIGESYSVLSDPEKRLKYNDEEELRDVLRNNSRSSHSGQSSEFYSSPFGRSSYSGRRSDFYGGRSSSQRNWEEESWRGYSSNHYRW